MVLFKHKRNVHVCHFFTVRHSIGTGESDSRLCCSFNDDFEVLEVHVSGFRSRICCLAAVLQLLDRVDQDPWKVTGQHALAP